MMGSGTIGTGGSGWSTGAVIGVVLGALLLGGLAVYAALLWAYGLVDRLADLADPDEDEEGTRLARSREPARARHRRTLSNDF